MKKVPFSPPDITESEVNLVSEALRSGWITTGPKTKEFERLIAHVLSDGASCMLEFGYGLYGVDIACFGRWARRRGDYFRLYVRSTGRTTFVFSVIASANLS